MQISEKEQDQQAIDISGTNPKTCIQCGKCSGSCPVAKHMDLLPHRVVWELSQGRISKVQQSNTPWKCLSCFACSARCPKSIDPAALIEAVRLSIIRKQGENRIKADDIPALMDENMPQQALVSIFRKYAK